MKVLKFPLIVLTLFFMAGIFIAKTFEISLNNVLIASAANLLILIVFFLLFRLGAKNILFTISACTMFFCIGLMAVQLQVPSEYDYSNNAENFGSYKKINVTIRERLKSTEKNHRYIALINHIDGNFQQGRLMLNVNKKDDKVFPIGTNLILMAKISEIKNNPSASFNYREYLFNKTIFGQIYTSKNFFINLNRPTKDLWFYADAIRNRILLTLSKSGMKSDESSIAAALLLGQQQDIRKDVKQDYQMAGAVHVLAVSGLHVGFVALFINFFIGRLPKTRRDRFIGLMATLLGLWCFAFVTGLTPSVVRAATMFSFIAGGINIRRITNIYNTLFVSAFLILLFKPSFLFDVGFQLSYTAVFSIVWLQPMFSKVWLPKYKILKYLWDLITVSVAAQIGTLPLLLYYFHQFPGLFIVTNILVIPLLTIVMFIGIIVVFLAALGLVIPYSVDVLSFLISLLNGAVHWVASMQDFVFKNIPFTIMMLFALYVVIFACAKWSEKFRFEYLLLGLLGVIGFQFAVKNIPKSNVAQSEFVVLNSSRESLFAKRFGQRTIWYAHKDSVERLKQKSKVIYYNAANKVDTTSELAIANAVSFGNNKILIVDSLAVIPRRSGADILILTSSCKINLDRVLKENKPSIVVADGSNYKSYVERWQRTCEKQNVKFHSTYRDGDFRVGLELEK